MAGPEEAESRRVFRKGDSILDRYEVSGVRRGGMGIVYLCADRKTGKPTVLKTLQAGFLNSIKRRDMFVREMKTWIELGKHPHIVQAYHIEEVDGLPLLAIEMVPPKVFPGNHEIGPDLGDYIDNRNRSGRPYDPDVVMQLGLHICRGMQHAQNRFMRLGLPFVHADLNPANILMTPDNIAKITDFGIARTGAELDSNFRTVNYASPEQLQSESVDIRSDVFSFGLILYAMCRGRNFYQRTGGDSREPGDGDWKRNMLRECSERFYDVTGELVNIIETCTNEKPGMRFSNFDEIAEAMISAYHGLTGEEPVEVGEEQEQASEIINRGYSLNYLGCYGEALSRFKDVLAGNPDIPHLWLNLGVSQYGLGRVSEAIESLNRALMLNPDYPQALYNLGYIYDMQNDIEAAGEYYGKAIEKDDRFIYAYLNLGIMLKRAGNIKEAIKRFEQALRIDSRWTPAWHELGCALHDDGETRQAIQSLQIAIMYDPYAEEAMDRLSEIYRGIGDLESARDWRRRADNCRLESTGN